MGLGHFANSLTPGGNKGASKASPLGGLVVLETGLPAKGKQSIITAVENLGGKHLVQGLVVIGVGNPSSQVGKGLNFRLLAKHGATHNQALETLLLQGPSIHVRVGHGAKQDHHVTRLDPLVSQGGKPLGDTLGRATPSRLHRPAPNRGAHHVKDDTGHLVKNGIRLLVHIPLWLKVQKPRPKHLGHGEDPIHQLQHVGMTPEIIREFNQPRLRVGLAHLIPEVKEHVHIRAPEPINALLGVPHRADI